MNRMSQKELAFLHSKFVRSQPELHRQIIGKELRMDVSCQRSRNQSESCAAHRDSVNCKPSDFLGQQSWNYDISRPTTREAAQSRDQHYKNAFDLFCGFKTDTREKPGTRNPRGGSEQDPQQLQRSFIGICLTRAQDEKRVCDPGKRAEEEPRCGFGK